MMVKPGMPYLDVIRLLRDNTTLPIAAYHVSGPHTFLRSRLEWCSLVRARPGEVQGAKLG